MFNFEQSSIAGNLRTISKDINVLVGASETKRNPPLFFVFYLESVFLLFTLLYIFATSSELIISGKIIANK